MMKREARRLILSLFVLALVSCLIGVVYFSVTWLSQKSVAFSCTLPVEPVTPYVATDLTGRSFSASHLFGKPTILFFGFTYCPELCPTTLYDISRWLDKLGPEADRLKILFVTIDPERDTPKVLKEYLSSFDKRIQGLILTPENLAIMTKEYQVAYDKIDLGHGQYTMDHEGSIFFLDSDGHVVEIVNYEELPEVVLPKLRKLANGTAQDWGGARHCAERR